MKNKILGLSLLLVFIQITSFLYADTLEIFGMQIPIIEGAKVVKDTAGKSLKAKIANYITDKPLNEAVSFYKSFLKANGFLVIGGLEAQGGFNASVKKGNIQFSIHIYAEGGLTKIQFIW